MHKKLIDEATHEQLKEFTKDYLSMLKGTNQELYEEAENILYKEVYGCHFNKWLLDKALAKMENEDGTKGGHWTLDQTTGVANQNGITFDTFNEYDWCYVLNMVYSDYYNAVDNNLNTFVKMAKKFLMDKDAPKGKAYIYYKSMS